MYYTDKKPRKKMMHGMRFGRLVVVSEAPSVKGRAMWLCQCDCGQIRTVAGSHLRNGNTTSCGCLQKEKTIDNNKARSTHGMCRTHIHRIWLHIKDRCGNEKCKSYMNYGGRGITICDEWKDDFQTFYDYVSKLPHFEEEGYSIDRINNDGNYEPGNVKWSTTKEQANNKRSNRVLEAFCEKHTVAEWSEKLGISDKTIMSRLRRGLSAEDALKIEKRGHQKCS